MAEEKKEEKIDTSKLDEIEALEKELNYLRQYKEALDKTTIISKTDPNGIIIDANEMFEKISGYKKEELIGKPHNIVRHPDMPKAVFKKMWDTIKQGKIFKGVIKNRKKDGGEYYVIANIVPIKDENGEIKEYVAIRQDITRRMKLQQEQQKFITHMIEYFLTKIKSPNLTINRYSQYIEEELNKENPNLEKIKFYNTQIRKEALMLQRVYENMQLLLEIRENKLKINIEPINLYKVIEHLYKKFHKYYQKKITIIAEDKKAVINTDKRLILRLLENIFVNALKFAKSEVTIKLYKEKEPIIEIIQDGGEIHNKEKLFNFFNELKHSDDIKEVGIGMFNVKKIINLFDYKLNISQTTNKIIFKIQFKTLPPTKLLKK